MNTEAIHTTQHTAENFTLSELGLSYFNEFLTVEAFAEYYAMPEPFALELIAFWRATDAFTKPVVQ